MRSKIEREDASHVDVGVRDRRDLPQEFARKLLRTVPDDRLHPLSVPGHHDIGQQRQIATICSGVKPRLAPMPPLWIARSRLCTASP